MDFQKLLLSVKLISLYERLKSYGLYMLRTGSLASYEHVTNVQLPPKMQVNNNTLPSETCFFTTAGWVWTYLKGYSRSEPDFVPTASKRWIGSKATAVGWNGNPWRKVWKYKEKKSNIDFVEMSKFILSFYDCCQRGVKLFNYCECLVAAALQLKYNFKEIALSVAAATVAKEFAFLHFIFFP